MMHRSRRVVVAALVCAGVAVPALLFVAQYPQWWVWIAQEQVPMTWFQSVTLVVAGVVGLVAWFVSRAAGRRPRLGFALLALGFAALAFDERFAIHERVRDGVLAPRDVRLPGLTWVAPGDFLLILVAVVGLVLVSVVVRPLRGDRAALTLFGIAVLLSVITVGTDSIDPGTWSVQGERVQQTLEECAELWAGLAFLGAMALRLIGLLSELTVPSEGPRSASDTRGPGAVEATTKPAPAAGDPAAEPELAR